MHQAMLWGAALAAALAPAAASGADLAPARQMQRPILILAMPGPNMLGTTAVPIRADRFRASWARAMMNASSSPLMRRLVTPASKLTPLQKLAYVQSRVSANIRWISDATEWGQHDYWASAAETLSRGAGDMEDRAIVKMHALRALGFSPGDLFLTMGRDQVGGPETVLSVRVAGRFYVLDDTGGAPYPAESRQREFQPLLSFGNTAIWVHTKPAAAAPVRVASAPIAR